MHDYIICIRSMWVDRLWGILFFQYYLHLILWGKWIMMNDCSFWHAPLSPQSSSSTVAPLQNAFVWFSEQNFSNHWSRRFATSHLSTDIKLFSWQHHSSDIWRFMSHTALHVQRSVYNRALRSVSVGQRWNTASLRQMQTWLDWQTRH